MKSKRINWAAQQSWNWHNLSIDGQALLHSFRNFVKWLLFQYCFVRSIFGGCSICKKVETLCNSKSHSKVKNPNWTKRCKNSKSLKNLTDLRSTWDPFGLHWSQMKKSSFHKASHSLETVWSFYAQTVLVPTLLSRAGWSVCFNELFLSNQEDIHSSVVIFVLFNVHSFYCMIMASDLNATPCLEGLCHSH
jgi:hypothetical protein